MVATGSAESQHKETRIWLHFEFFKQGAARLGSSTIVGTMSPEQYTLSGSVQNKVSAFNPGITRPVSGLLDQCGICLLKDAMHDQTFAGCLLGSA